MAKLDVILNLFDKNDKIALEEQLKSTPEKEVRSLIKRNVRNNLGNQSVAVIKAIFLGSPENTDDGQERRRFVYEESLTILQQDLSSQLATELIGILLLQMDDISAENMSKLAIKILDLIRNNNQSCGRCMELLPKLITTITNKDRIPYTDNEITGEQFKKHFIDDLCSLRWNAKNATQFATVFREIPLSATELQFVLEKLIRLFDSMEFSEIPSFIYQLLLLSTQDKGTNQLVLEGILTFFNSENKKQSAADSLRTDDTELEEIGHSVEELRHLEGTVLLHITFAMTQNLDLGKEFVKFFKMGTQNPRYILTPFTIALGLAVTRFQSFQDSIFDSFKSAIVKHFKELEIKKSSQWFREMIPDNVNVEKTFLDVVKNSSFGWDYVTQGLVELGLILMEINTTKAVGRKPNVESKTTESIPTENPISKLGSNILLNVFKASELVRSTMIERILNLIFTKATSAKDYVDLLSSIIQTCPLFVLESVSKIQRTLDCMPMLPPVIANGLFKALFPLLKVNMSLKESLMIILRKALFSGQLECRKIAVTGYLHLLKNFKILGYLPMSQSSQTLVSSQVNADVHSRINPEINEALCLEMLGTLTCALNQQVEIRQILYEGLYNVLCENKKMRGPILNIFLQQLEKYFECNKNVNPPLKLDSVLSIQNDTVTITESLPMLIQFGYKSMVDSKHHVEMANFDEPDSDNIQICITKLEDIISSLTERMIAAELEDFELDKSADYSTTTTVGMKNSQLAITLLGIYEILMEYLCELDKSASTSNKVLALFKNYKNLLSVVKEKSTGKTAGKVANIKLPNSSLSVESITKILKNLVDNEDEEMVALRESDEFLRFIVNAASQKILNMKQNSFIDVVNPKRFSVTCQLAGSLFRYYNLHSSVDDAKIRSLSSLCLESFSNITAIISTYQSKKIIEFLINIESGKNSEFNFHEFDNEEPNRVYSHIIKFQNCVDEILRQNEDDRSHKEIVFLTNIITTLIPHLDPDENHSDLIFTWVHNLCVEQNLGDTSAVKSVILLLFALLNQIKKCSPVARELAQDIHYRLGDIDDGIEVEESKNFALVTEGTAPVITQILLQYLDQILSNVDWVINILKADLVSSTKIDLDDDQVPPTQQEMRDKKICNCLGTLFTALHELVQTACPVGVTTITDRLLKVLIHVHSTLNLFVKYYISMYNLKVGKLCSRFEKLVKVSGTMLSPQVYSLITYLQNQQNDDSQKENKKRTVTSITLKSKVLRETRQIPQLIYTIEQYETSLLQLAKKTKINFTQSLKLSTARDFRIDVNKMKAIPQISDDEEETVEINNEQNNDDENEEQSREMSPPPAKKSKLQKSRKTKN